MRWEEWLGLLAGVLPLVWEKLRGLWLNQQETVYGVAAVLLFALAVEVLDRRGWRRYLSRNFRTDATYTLFYVGGFYSFLFAGPIYGALSSQIERRAPFLQAKLLDGLHPAAQLLVLLPVMDLVAYWTHRWLHSNRFLWTFHRLHHSQTSLTPLTAYRVHVVEILLLNLGKFVVALALGLPGRIWLPVSLITLWVPLLAHSDLGWSYGPLGRMIVSPRFHSVHHSVEREHYDRNFGQVFTFWDDVFGTAVRGARRPPEYGVPGISIPESFLRQLFHPFLAAVRGPGAARQDPR